MVRLTSNDVIERKKMLWHFNCFYYHTKYCHMVQNTTQSIIDEYIAFIENKTFPCVAARAALSRQQLKCMVAGHMACPKDDAEILKFIYNFVDEYRQSTEDFHSVAIIFEQPQIYSENMFEQLMWQRLQALANADAQHFGYDKRVDADPQSANFSFSLKEEAFFIIGLHPASSRPTRQFKYPTLVLNPHAQFEALRTNERYTKMKQIIRKRDIAYSGSVNPMLEDFGNASEVYQYSGRKYDHQWQCPLKLQHANTEHHPAT